MRIALVLEPLVEGESPVTQLDRALKDAGVPVVVLPDADPLTRALRSAVQTHEPGSDGLVVIARQDAVGADDDATERISRLNTPVPEIDETPDVEAAIAEGALQLDEGNLAEAERAYGRADELLSTDTGPRRAEVLVCLATIEMARGSSASAAILLDRALAIFPNHQAALRHRIELARSESDAATAAALRRRLLRFADNDDERATLLSSIADESLTATTEALREALTLRPKDPRLLERLQATLEASGRWKEAVDAKVAVSETIPDARSRARALTAAAGMCARRTGDVARAVALYEAAIADDPSTPGAFEAIEATLVRDEDWPSVERAYARQLERLRDAEQDAAQVALLEKLARLRVEKLGNLHGAIEALDRLVVVDPQNVEARIGLASGLEKTNQLELAARCLEVAARYEPTRAETFHDLSRICTEIGDVDRAHSACAVLVHLGEATAPEQRTYEDFAPLTTRQPRSAFESDTWKSIQQSDHDHVIGRIAAAIAPAAIEYRAEQLRASGRLPVLAEKDRIDVEKSTLTAARSAAWTCAVLGIDTPMMYSFSDDLAGGVGTVPLIEPTLVFGKNVLSGRSVPELVFAIGRDLAYQSLSSSLITFYPTLQDLRALFIAAVAQVLGTDVPADAATLRDGLKSHLGPMSQEKLVAAVGELQDRGGRLELKAWVQDCEIAACRAGLILCGDITAAARMLAVDGRVVSGLSAAERIRDLIPYSVSERCSATRKQLGIEARAGA